MNISAYATSAFAGFRTDNARNLAIYIEEKRFGADGDGLHFGPTDAALAARALRSYAARRSRRVATTIFAGAAVVVMTLASAGGRSENVQPNLRSSAFAQRAVRQ